MDNEPSKAAAITVPTAALFAARLDVWNEVKRIVGACLGTGSVAGMTFEQLVRWLATPKNAVKFVIRRIGLAAAVGCIGGIIWEYI